jgi:hypothetical protein
MDEDKAGFIGRQEGKGVMHRQTPVWAAGDKEDTGPGLFRFFPFPGREKIVRQGLPGLKLPPGGYGNGDGFYPGKGGEGKRRKAQHGKRFSLVIRKPLA